MLPKITTFLRTDRQRNGKSAIVIQVRFKNQRRQVFTGLFVKDSNFKNGVVSGTNADWYNASIKKEMAKLEAEYLKATLHDKPITLAQTKTSARRSFIEYAKDFYSNLSSAGDDYKFRAKAAIEKLHEYAGNISFEQLTPQLMKDFELSMKDLSRNTINRIFKRIKQPARMAIKEDLLNKDPFFIYTPPTYQQPKRDFLTMEEIKLIEDANILPSLENIRSYFLLSCYTGLRYSDLQKFNPKKHIITTKGVKRIVIGTTKTKEVVSIKMSANVHAIIEGITGPLPTNVHCNRLLKDIVAAAEIKRNITFHTGRHSFAVNSAVLGIPIEAVAKLLGHSSIRTTAIYYKIVDTKIDEYMDRWG